MKHCLVCAEKQTQEFSCETLIKNSPKSQKKNLLIRYFFCPHCEFTFTDPQDRLDFQLESQRYQYHEYDDTPKYRSFYNKLLTQMKPLIKSPVLDFGSGPNSLMAKIWTESGHEVSCYDPLFFPDSINLLNTTYPSIYSTEAFEHFFDPLQELHRINESLRTGGTLGIMTSFHPGIKQFNDWHYRKDPTHVGFFSPVTFTWIAKNFSFQIAFLEDPVCILIKF